MPGLRRCSPYVPNRWVCYMYMIIVLYPLVLMPRLRRCYYHYVRGAWINLTIKCHCVLLWWSEAPERYKCHIRPHIMKWTERPMWLNIYVYIYGLWNNKTRVAPITRALDRMIKMEWTIQRDFEQGLSLHTNIGERHVYCIDCCMFSLSLQHILQLNIQNSNY